MKKLYSICLALFCFSSIAAYHYLWGNSNVSLMNTPSICAEPDVVAHFDLNACHSYINTTNKDYSEFEPEYIDTASCGNYRVIGGYLYRNNPEQNIHSCTPGIEGSDAMCVGPSPSCDFIADDDRAIRIDFRVQADPADQVILSGLSFFEKAPEMYDWILGDEGPNNYPLYYGIRILKNGDEVYFQDSIETNREWGKVYFDFTHEPAFTVTDTSIFEFELLAYCLAGIEGTDISVWDIDEISLLSCCEPCSADAGVISTTDQTIICVEDNVDDIIQVDVIGQVGQQSQFLITDAEGNILDQTTDSNFNFESAGIGTCYIQHISYDGDIVGLENGNNINKDLFGCFDLSNQIEVIRTIVNGGVISTNSQTTFCTGDGQSDLVEINVSDALGQEQTWVTTDEVGVILNIENPPFEFEGLPSGTCFIWYVSSYISITEAHIGTNINDIESCISLSNSIEINRSFVHAGEISTASLKDLCSGDGIPDIVNLELSGNEGNHQIYILSRVSDGLIIETFSTDSYDFETAGTGQCNITHAVFDLESDVPEAGSFMNELSGCFDLSNSIQVNRSSVNGGNITTDDLLSICTGDGKDDIIDFTLVDEEGSNSAWIISNVNEEILEITTGPPFNFEGTPSGICVISHLSYNGSIQELEEGASFDDLVGCFEFSNSIEIDRTQFLGGQISTEDPTSICSGDGESDPITVILQDELGPENIYLITDTLNNILELNETNEFDFDQAPEGVCYIYHLSFGSITDLPQIGENISEFDFCYGISNPIEVIRSRVEASVISSSSELELCVGDGISDLVEVELSGFIANNEAWVITDLDNVVINLPIGPPFDFDGAGTGTCLIWHINFNGTISNLDLGNTLDQIEGCHAISEPITVVRKEVSGGMISTTSATTLCINGEDNIVEASVSGATGSELAWIISDVDGIILDIPTSPPFDFSEAGSGQCLIWHAAYDDPNLVIQVGDDINTFVDCFDLSNPILILRTSVSAAEISTVDETDVCSGDGLDDLVNVDLSNNSASAGIYVITDTLGNILDTTSMNSINFENAGAGICQIWHISYEGVILGVEPGFNLATIAGCFGVSNAIEVNRSEIFGGSILTNESTMVCSGDGIPDLIEVNFNNAFIGDSSVYLITDLDANILGVQSDPVFDFEPAGPGVCFIWHLAYNGDIDLSSTTNVNDLVGCFSLSNSISVERISISASSISTDDETTICVGDTIPDIIEVDLIGSNGPNSSWVITDTLGNIINISLDPIFAFTNAGEGVCLIWHLDYHDGLFGLEEGSNVSNFEGCYAFSNAIEVVRSDVDGGFIFANGSTTICLSKDIVPPLNVGLVDNQGEESLWIISDEDGRIIDLPESPPFDFSTAPAGNCIIQHISYTGDLVGAEIGNDISEIKSCLDFSNEILVQRIVTEGGNVTTDGEETEVSVCVGDMNPDTIRFIANNQIGPNYQFVVTDENGSILALPDTNYVDFESNSIGTCKVYGVSYSGIRTMLPGQDILVASLSTGCFDVSDGFLSVKRVEDGEACNGFATMLLGDIDFSVYPNPATEELFIDIESIPSLQSDIRIFDIYGNLVLKKELEFFNPNNIPIDISDFSRGVYVVQIYSIGVYAYKQFVVDK